MHGGLKNNGYFLLKTHGHVKGRLRIPNITTTQLLYVIKCHCEYDQFLWSASTYLLTSVMWLSIPNHPTRHNTGNNDSNDGNGNGMIVIRAQWNGTIRIYSPAALIASLSSNGPFSRA
jgi:hypothetical protein